MAGQKIRNKERESDIVFSICEYLSLPKIISARMSSRSHPRLPHTRRLTKNITGGSISNLPMHDYEIRDVMKRSTSAELFVTLRIESGHVANARVAPNQEELEPLPLIVTIGNRLPEPAYYTLVTLGLDTGLTICDPGRFEPMGITITPEGHRLKQLQKRIGLPESYPIFREATTVAGDRPICISCRLLPMQNQYLIRSTVQTPGFSNTEDWILERFGPQLRLRGPLPLIP